MTSVSVLLNSIDKVKSFVNDVSPLDTKMDLVSDEYSVDAKSIMGIFSLNILDPLTLNIHGNHDEQVIAIDKVKDYICA